MGILVQCVICKKEINKAPYEIRNSKTGKFTCGDKKCKGAWRSIYQTGRTLTSEMVKCPYCGTENKAKQNILKRNKNGMFCNRECYGAWLSENNKGENHPRWNGGKVEIYCAQCGDLVGEKHPCRLKSTNNSFCKPECLAAWMTANRSGEKHPSWTGRVSVTCAICGEPKTVPPWQTRMDKVFVCGTVCQGKWISANLIRGNHHAWRGGTSLYPSGWKESLKEAIRDRDNRHCQVCGKTESENGSRLDVHHIDYDKDNLSKENLISLCKSCHTKTNSNRDYWQSYFTGVEEVAANG